jgi:glycosyltransferase involved in cell wall biosynthesis
MLTAPNHRKSPNVAENGQGQMRPIDNKPHRNGNDTNRYSDNGMLNDHTTMNGQIKNGGSQHQKLRENGHAVPRILFLSYRFPYPLIGGDRIKAYHLVKRLSTIARVDLIALDEARSANTETIPELEVFADVRVIPFNKRRAALRIAKHLPTDLPIEFAYYNDADMQRAVDEALASNHYDLIICFFLRTAMFVRDHTTTPKLLVAEDARVILEERAIEQYSVVSRLTDQIQYLVRKIDAERLRSYEPQAMSEGFARVTFVSKVDERRIRLADPNLPTGILTNGVSLSEYEFCAGEREDKLIFFGHLGTYHNILMATRLLKNIYPKIREVSPRTKLAIVGKSPGKELQKLVERTPGAELHPDVKDIRPFLRSCKVLVHAQTVGAGIQNKLLEAMAMGTPIVTTPVGASGIEGLEDNVNALIRTTDQEMIEATLSLLKNDEKALRLARNSRELIESCYTWEHVYHSLDSIIREIVPGFFEIAHTRLTHVNSKT